MAGEHMTEAEYQAKNKADRDARMRWWREARFGMFIHFGIYSVIGRGEWVRMREGIPDGEYRAIAEELRYPEGTAERWARLAKAAGMKYVILTTQHHDGFALWDSQVNPFNSVRIGPHRDIVADFVSACRKEGLGVGLYFSLWNWEHPDGMRCAHDEEARRRFTAYVTEEVRELMSRYGKIDILWYDVASPLTTAEAWDSLERNRMVRELQPAILINNRSRLDEDFGTPEDKVEASGGDWEACMRFTTIGFGGVPQRYAAPYRMTPQQIVKLLANCTGGGGNLVFNVSPDGEGRVCEEEAQALERVGAWLSRHGEAVYGIVSRGGCGANGICTATRRGGHVYLWNWLWPDGGTMAVNGYSAPPRSVRCLTTGEEAAFAYRDGRILITGLPAQPPDPTLGITVFDLDFGEPPVYRLLPRNAVL